MVSVRYKPDLKLHLSRCEANYMQLMRLLPLIEEQDDIEFAVHRGGDVQATVLCEVLERSVYTSFLRIHEMSTLSPAYDLHIELRIYHDAKMAEVTKMQQKRLGQSRYQQPNKDMFYVDEKRQANELMAQCLQNWLEHGLSGIKMWNIPHF